MELEETRDIKRALEDIKLLLAYIEGKEFQVAFDIQITKQWEICDMSQNYPICDSKVFRVYVPELEG